MSPKILYTALLCCTLAVTACKSNSPSNENPATAQKPTIHSNLDKAFANCQEQFFEQNQPNLSLNLAKNTYPLCFDSFAVMYSGVSKTPMWVAEYLTKERLLQAKELPRDDNFHEEKQLPKEVRSQLADYKRSGYDRGHLAPNGDMPTQKAQYDSFSLANIAPQVRKHNSPTWSKVEYDTRGIAYQYGSAYVITGVAFLDKNIKMLNNNVFIPSHFFKAIYVPSLNQAKVYFSPNNDKNQVEIISVNDLQQRTGIDVFPQLSNPIKATIGTFENNK